MYRLHPGSTRTYTLLPSTTRFRSQRVAIGDAPLPAQEPRPFGQLLQVRHPLPAIGDDGAAQGRRHIDLRPRRLLSDEGKESVFGGDGNVQHELVRRGPGHGVADFGAEARLDRRQRSEEHTSELQSLMRISY